MTSPVPKPDARKQRHAVAEASSSNRLPTAGRSGRPPKAPVELGEAGARWWRWAWSTPQATKWHKGFLEPLGRRAQLEDEYQAIGRDLDAKDASMLRTRLLGIIVRYDDAFGFTPLGAAKQHMVFVDVDPEPTADRDDNVTPIRKRIKGA